MQFLIYILYYIYILYFIFSFLLFVIKCNLINNYSKKKFYIKYIHKLRQIEAPSTGPQEQREREMTNNLAVIFDWAPEMVWWGGRTLDIAAKNLRVQKKHTAANDGQLKTVLIWWNCFFRRGSRQRSQNLAARIHRPDLRHVNSPDCVLWWCRNSYRTAQSDRSVLFFFLC